MIYAIYASKFLKKMHGDKVVTTTWNALSENIVLDPETSAIEGLVLTEKDISDINKVNALLDTMHRNIECIYLYTKKDHTFTNPRVTKIKVNKIDVQTCADEVQDMLQNINNKQRDLSVNKEFVELEEEIEFDIQSPEPIVQETEPIELEFEDVFVDIEQPTREPEKNRGTEFSSTEVVSNIYNCDNWDAMMAILEKDAIINGLIKESQRYAGIQSQLNAIETKLLAVFNDMSLTADDRYAKVIELVKSKTSGEKEKNDMLSKKVCEIAALVTEAANRKVEEAVTRYRQAIHGYKTQLTSLYGTVDFEEYNQLTEKRSEAIRELNEISVRVVDVFALMDTTYKEIIKEFNENIPSSNQHVNQLLNIPATEKVWEGMFEKRLELLEDLEAHRGMFDSMMEHINSIVHMLLEIIDIDSQIITKQTDLIEYLRARNIESTVNIDTLYKKHCRVYTGFKGTGLHTTVLTKSRLDSRKANVCVIDLTECKDYTKYSEDVKPLTKVLEEMQFENVVFTTWDYETFSLIQLREVVEQLAENFRFINIMVRPDFETDIYDIADLGVSINYLTDCTATNLEDMRKIVNTNIDNVATNIITVSAPNDVPLVIEKLGVEGTGFKLIPIPFLPEIKEASLRGLPVYKDKLVQAVVSDAFRS